MKTETIELIGGYTAIDKDTKKEVVHKKVTFGKRLTAKDLIDLENHPQAANPTQHQDLIRRQMITKFGTLIMPVTLNALLSLDSIDRDDLDSAADRFLVLSREDRTGGLRENHEVKLMFGFEIDGAFYDVVTFGNRITGKDEVEADSLGLAGLRRNCFLIGKQISRISTDGGAAEIKGQIDLEKFDSLDSEDLSLLGIGAEVARQFFRVKRNQVSTKPNSPSGVSGNEGNRDDGKRGDESSERAD